MAAPTRPERKHRRSSHTRQLPALGLRPWLFWLLLLVAPSLLLAGCMMLPVVEGGWWVVLAIAAALGLAACKSSDDENTTVDLTPVVSKLVGLAADEAGTSVAGAGNFGGDANADIVIGAPGGPASGGGTFQTGRAYVLLSPPAAGESNLTEVADVLITAVSSSLGGLRMGTSVAFAGDLLGDTHSELIVGAPNSGGAFAPYGGSQGAEAYVLTGTAIPAAALDIVTPSDVGRVVYHFFEPNLFRPALGIGDFDGDGTPDLLSANPAGNGSISLISGSHTGGGTPPGNDLNDTGGDSSVSWSGFTLVGQDFTNNAVGSAAAALNWNGDLYNDVAVGAPVASFTATATVHVILGDAGALEDSAAQACAASAEVIVVNDSGDFTGQNCDPAGTPTYVPHPAGFTIVNGTDPSSTELFGYSLAAGDVNGDGHADLAIGSPGYNLGDGRVYLLLGDGSTAENVDISTPPLPGGLDVVTIDPPSAGNGDSFGTTVAMTDLNGDGRDEVIIGAPDAPLGAGDGQITAIMGRANIGDSDAVDTSGLTYGTTVVANSNALTLQGAPGEFLGASLANAGDMDGDGREELLVGAPVFGDNNGAVYVIRLKPAP